MDNVRLLEIQKEAIKKFWKTGNLLVVLPTGTGKTVVALTIIQQFVNKLHDKFKCLIVVPANLRTNITQNIDKFKFRFNAQIIKNVQQFLDSYENNNVFVVSYNFLRLHPELFVDKQWDLLICDELHYAKNIATKNYKALFYVRANSKHMLGLTASPVANTPEEFFNIVALIANDKSLITLGKNLVKYGYEPGVKPPLWARILFGAKPKPGKKIPIGFTDPEAFKRLFSPYVYIPDEYKVQQIGKRPEIKSYVINVELTKFESKAYKYALKQLSPVDLWELKTGSISSSKLREIKNKIMAAQQTLLSPDYIYKISIDKDIERSKVTLSQFRPGSKIKVTAERLKQTGNKSIVYTSFVTFGARLANLYFNSVGIKSAEYSGHIKPEERQKIIDSFEHGDLQVICLTGAGQEGINLPSCKDIYFLNLPWHEEALRQVIGRALRVTSKNPYVNVYWIFATINGKETIDHWMSKIIQRKALMRNVIFNLLKEDIAANVTAALPGIETYEPVGYKSKKNKLNKKLPLLNPYPER